MCQPIRTDEFEDIKDDPYVQDCTEVPDIKDVFGSVGVQEFDLDAFETAHWNDEESEVERINLSGHLRAEKF